MVFLLDFFFFVKIKIFINFSHGIIVTLVFIQLNYDLNVEFDNQYNIF